MNKNILFCGLSIGVMLPMLTGCSEEQFALTGEGKIFLSTRVNSDVMVVSRAEAEDDLAATTQIRISSDKGVVRKFNSMNEVPTDGVKLAAGSYTVEAWAGTPAYASFTDRWFEGSEDIILNAGDNLAVEVECKIQNICSSVVYSETAKDAISDYTLTVSNRGGTLTYEGDDSRRGYFMMPEGDTSLDWTLTATVTADGKEFTKTGTINDVKPGHEYVINVGCGSESEIIGGGFIQIEVDDRTIDHVEKVVITTPPSITGYVSDCMGYNFDISKPIAGPSNTIGETSIYVCAASELKSVMISGLEGIEDFDFCGAKESVLREVAAKGVTNSIENAGDGQMMKVIFSADYCNSLQNRDEAYVVTIKATDKGNKTSTAILRFKISEAPVLTEQADASLSDYDAVTLSGHVAKDGVETVGFLYRTVGQDDWQYVAGTPLSRAGLSKGDIYTAKATGLPYDAVCEYKAVSGPTSNPTEYSSGDLMTVATKPTPQMPNSDMETWGTTNRIEKNTIVPSASDGTAFWDCGNHGSMLMGYNVTTSTSEKKHSGKYAAKLLSTKVVVALAAGNIVTGEYKETVGTNGIFGFGREFDFHGLKPKALRLWVHYTPSKVDYANSGTPLAKGEMDQGHIFIALFDGQETMYGHTAPYVVHTGEKHYFDKNASQVMAFGEKVFTEATAGNDMVMLEIPINYYSETRVPKYIAVVCTASRYGDYFNGGSGSCMYVDDFQLVY